MTSQMPAAPQTTRDSASRSAGVSGPFAALSSALTIALAILVGAPSTASAQSTFESDRFAYSVDIPEGWSRIPDDRITEAYVERLRNLFAGGSGGSEARKAVARKSKLDLLVQRDPDAGLGQPPLMLVFAFNLRDLDVPESGVDDFFRGAVREAKKRRDEIRTFDFDEGLSDPEPGEVLIDSTNLQYIVSSTSGQQGSASHRGFVWLKAGKSSGIMLIFTVPRKDWPTTSEARKTVFESFRLDEDQVAEGAQTSRRAYEIGRKVGRYGVLIGCPVCGLVMLLVIGFVIYRLVQD